MWKITICAKKNSATPSNRAAPFFSQILSVFGASSPAPHADEVVPGPHRPVFIVGMPRSGTSRTARQTALSRLRRQYLHEFERLKTDCPVITDKMPVNFRWLGFILSVFPETKVTRKLLDYCELGWHDDCLNFHQTRRAVSTASATQVKRKLYTGSSQAWRKYETHLASDQYSRANTPN
jgi:hypothetical protein